MKSSSDTQSEKEYFDHDGNYIKLLDGKQIRKDEIAKLIGKYIVFIWDQKKPMFGLCTSVTVSTKKTIFDTTAYNTIKIFIPHLDTSIDRPISEFSAINLVDMESVIKEYN